jgi:putative membrane protein
MKLLTVATLAITLLIVPVFAQKTQKGADKGDTEQPKNIGAQEKQFLKDAFISNMAEIEIGKLAEQKAEAKQVKEFGTRMIHDHSANEDRLKTLAQTEKVTLPSELDAKHKNLKDSLSQLSGAKFDKAYMAQMVEEHKKDVQKFQKESTTARAPSVKDFAKTTLPTLKDHLRDAKEIDGKIASGAMK